MKGFEIWTLYTHDIRRLTEPTDKDKLSFNCHGVFKIQHKLCRCVLFWMQILNCCRLIFWTDHGKHEVLRATMNGSYKLLINTEFLRPNGLAADTTSTCIENWSRISLQKIVGVYIRFLWLKYKFILKKYERTLLPYYE